MLKLFCCSKTGENENESHPPRPVDINTAVKINTSSSSVKSTITTQLDNLWQIAFDKLGDDGKHWLSIGAPSSTEDAILQVIAETEQKYKEYQEGGLKIRHRDGRVFNLRDSTLNILESVSKARDLVKSATSFDPTGYASKAWGVVSIGLMMVTNDIERRDAAFEAAEFLAGELAFFSLIDGDRFKGAKANQELEDGLVTAYRAILQYTVEVRKKYHENAAARVFNSLVSLTEQPLEKLKSAVAAAREKVVHLASVNRDLRHRDMAERTLSSIDEAIETIKKTQDTVLTAEEMRILDWLSAAPYSNIQNDTQNRRTANTHDWFLVLPEYQDWKITPGKLYWLTGAAGCGKSVLCSTIIKDVMELCEGSPAKRFAYWYFQFNDHKTHRVVDMVRSMIRQLCPRPLPEELRKLSDDHSHRGSQPDHEQLCGILDSILHTLSGEAFIVLDALDECPDSPEYRERSSLLSLLQILVDRHGEKLHVLATSRPEPDIKACLTRYMVLDLERVLAKDVETFVLSKINDGELKHFDDELREMVMNRLLKLPERRFRWADLQIKRLEECSNKDQIIEALGTIPETLEATYKDVLNRIPQKDRDIARKILIWLSFAFIPLSLRAVAAAASLQFPDRAVKICSTSLVTVGTSDDYIRLAHFSVKEFLILEGVSTGSHWCQFSAMIGHKLIATKSIDYLLSQTEVLTRKASTELPLFEYAAEYWHSHVGTLDVMENQGLSERIDRLFCQPTCYINWIRVSVSMKFRRLRRTTDWELIPEECPPPIIEASRLGLGDTVNKLLELNANGIMPFCSDKSTYISAFLGAARNGHLEVLDLLLTRSGIVASIPTCNLLRLLDHRKCGLERLKTMLSKLLDMQLLADRKTEACSEISEERVINAAANEVTGLALMTIFLEWRDEVDFPITEEVIFAALQNVGCGKAIMELLLDQRAEDVHISHQMLQHVGEIRNLDALRFLLRKRFHEITPDPSTIRVIARCADHTVMQLLLNLHGNGIQVSEDVLASAVLNKDDPEMIRVLTAAKLPDTKISHQILANAVRYRRNPLDIMEFLLDQCGPDFPIGEGVMLAVAQNSNGLEIMRMLLRRQQAGFTVSQEVLDAAVFSAGFWRINDAQAVEMLKLLMDNGSADVLITDNVVCSAVRFPAALGYLFELKGESLPITSRVLVRAGVESLKMILQRRPDTRIPDEAFISAYQHEGKMRLLLQQTYGHVPVPQIVEELNSVQEVWLYTEVTTVISLLLERQLLSADEQLLEKMAHIPGVVRMLLDETPNILITQKAICQASLNVGALRILLDERVGDVTISEDVVISALSTWKAPDAIRLILNRFGAKTPFTRKILLSAMSQGLKSLNLLLLQRRSDINLEEAWETAFLTGFRSERLAVESYVALSKYTHFVIPAAALEKAFQEMYSVKFFEGFISLCIERELPIQWTDRVIEMVFEKCCTKVIKTFLTYMPGIVATERLAQALERNQKAKKDGLLSLLGPERRPLEELALRSDRPKPLTGS
ncbi:hypothetical protein BDV59DRAFT_94919 [Aspergillus ambiguus]|uniref:uncharacterized protein n=1 Tax=Aspergillus ambiguus TaxID=176160 RepID=UPI003CCE26DB